MKILYTTAFIGSILVLQFVLFACAKSPSACFTLPHANPFKVGENIRLDASCSEKAFYYSWFFKDGTYSGVSDNPVTNHTYSDSGTYMLKLIAERKNSNSSVVELEVIVNP
jgi:PKD repeat protein